MTHLLATLLDLPDYFARGGGGGSGGGGGGGGGGSGGSGGGGIGGLIILLGYVPTHFWGAFLRKQLAGPIGLALMIVGTLVYGIIWGFFGTFGIIVSLAAFVGGPVGYFDWFGKASLRVRGHAKKKIADAASKDPAWNEQTLVQRAHDTFMNFQADWSNFNVANFKSYMTPNYAYHMELMMFALQQRQRRNLVENPQLIEAYPIEAHDAEADHEDRVTFLMHGKAHDVLVESINGQDEQLFADNNDFYEYWHFVRSGNTWLLENISQSTEDATMYRSDVEVFAQTNKLYFSPDWGWLLLPRRGQLFGSAKFGTSDINNHVIGVYKDLLIEIYTYVPNPNSNSSNNSQYTIAQVALPKRYDSLIVEAKTGGLLGGMKRTPKGYNKLTLEWPDFNKRYVVYATNVEQVTVFELLHPVYMEKLFDLPFKVSIEVVDNVVYLYTKDKGIDYNVLYGVLKDAFEEMKL